MKARGKQIQQLIKVIVGAVIVILLCAFYLLRLEKVSPKFTFQDLYPYPKTSFPKLTVSQSLNLGGGHSRRNHPINSFLEFSESKKPGTIRIGIFGCSFVKGTEVLKGHDFPSLVQDQCNKAGMKNVEVINFGLQGRGVHHMYMLWEFLGKNYSLDYVVFLLFDFHRQRDCIFGGQYGTYHARYIINDGALELLPVVGNTRSEVFEIYHRIIPPWRYIRYDYSMPLFLKAALPSILQNRTNPFYYKLSKENEILKTYEMLFNKLSEQVDNLIIIANDDKSYSLRENIDSPNVYFMRSQVNQNFNSFLYHAKRRHNSYMGNQIRAKELFSLLMGDDKPKLDIIKLSDNFTNPEINSLAPSPALYTYSEISVKIGQQPVASFMIDISKKLKRPYFQGEYLSFQKHKIASLLMMKARGVHFIKFIPLSFLLQDEAPVSLSFMKDNELIEFPIGIINAPAGIVGKLLLNSKDHRSFLKRGEDWLFEIKHGNILLQASGNITDAYILVGGRKILKGIPSSKNIIFQPMIADFAYLRTLEGQMVDIDTLKEKEGELDLVLRNNKGQMNDYPIIAYKISTANTSIFNPIYPNPILQNN